VSGFSRTIGREGVDRRGDAFQAEIDLALRAMVRDVDEHVHDHVAAVDVRQIRDHRIDQPFQRRPIDQARSECTKAFARTAHR
jgi:hypothetical protein